MSGPGATPAVARQLPWVVCRPGIPGAINTLGGWLGPSLRARLLSVLPLIAIVAACAPIEQRPPEQRTQVVEVKIPVPTPCFTEAERPILPPPTPVDIDHATVDQLAAALAADDANEALYARAVDALFLQCLKSTGGTK